MGGLALIFVLATSLFGEETTTPSDAVLDNLVATVPVPEGIDRKAAMNACVIAALGREWKVVSKEENIIKINLIHRSWNATVYFVVKDDIIEMYSDSYTINKKTGERKKKKDPTGWIKFLRKDITKRFDGILFLE